MQTNEQVTYIQFCTDTLFATQAKIKLESIGLAIHDLAQGAFYWFPISNGCHVTVQRASEKHLMTLYFLQM